MKLGTNIFTLRTQKGLSQGDLADALQVSRQSISKWETGGATPDLDKLLVLCDLFGVTLDELVRDEIVEASPAETAAADAATVPAGKATPAPEDNPSMLRTVLICILVVLGILMLPSIFMSPGAWPGILLLLVIGGLFFAIVTRARENEAAQSEQERKKSSKKQLRIVLLLLGILLLFVLGLVFTLHEPTPYAQAAGTSSVIPRTDSPIQWMALNGGKTAISYTVQNTSSEDFILSNEHRRVEVKKNGTWCLLKELATPTYTPNTFGLRAGESHSSHFYLQQLYGRLSPGEYRMLFYVYSHETPPTEKYWIAKEFTIQ